MRQVQRITTKDREEWHRLRMEDITASAAGALFGHHKYTTLRAIAAEKCARNPPDDARMNKAMRRGRIMEPAIAQAMMVDHGIKISPVPVYLRMRDDADPYVRIGATKDYQGYETAERLAELPGFTLPNAWERYRGGLPMHLTCELKNVKWDVYQREWQDGPPLYHYAQAATQAFLADDDGALLIALVGEFLDLHIYPVVRSPAFEEELCSRVADFWRRVEAGEAQPVQAGDPAKSVFPDVDLGKVADLNGSIDLDDDDATMLGEAEARTGEVASAITRIRSGRSGWSDRLRLRAAMTDAAKFYKKAGDAIAESLKMSIGEAEKARINGWRVTWKKTKTGARSLRIYEEKSR